VAALTYLTIAGRSRWFVALAAALAVAAPARADPVAQWQTHIEEASQRFGVPADWIRRVIRAESGGGRGLAGGRVVSHAGAMGLMQLMPGTWADMRERLRLGSDPHAPRDNILAGSFYLRLMYERFGYPGLFAAYNAGPTRYAAVLGGRARLPAETRAYVTAIAGRSGERLDRRVPAEPAEVPSVFVPRREAASAESMGTMSADRAVLLKRDALFLIKPAAN